MAEPRSADRPVPPLIGQLPPQCQKDVNELRRFVHGMVAQETPAAPVSTDDIQEVLLTGANGFVGRFFLRELLRQNDRLIVHCLVRAGSVEDGLERLRGAMEYAEIWEEDFTTRLRVVPGDIRTDRFGLTETAFDGLCQRIDAVYHFATDVSLVLSYANIREANVLGLRTVLQLCLRTRYKHLFYASTIAVFPQYYCDFAKEYRRSRIDDQMQPDLAGMKKAFPLGSIGYPWSKLVAEQGVLAAQAAGVPVGIFRLPLMEVSGTGYTQSSSFTVRMFAAAVLVGKIPQGFAIQKMREPADTVCEICASISMNSRRRFTIYHLCDPTPPDDLDLTDIGLYFESVSYQSFRRSCQALGDSSPLRGQWVLIDHFAPYWFNPDKAGNRMPISDRAIREDCPHPIRWPKQIIRHARSSEWVRRHQEDWPYQIPQCRLDFDRLMGQARVYTEHLGVPFDYSYPEWMRAGLERLVGTLHSPEAGIREGRLSNVIYALTRSLRHNAALAHEWQQHPEIEQEKITRPVFIIGINRTGTTFLHRLLARDRRFWALRNYELTAPMLTDEDYADVAGTAEDPRREYAKDLLRVTNAADILSGLHLLDIDEPEEDLWVLLHSFSTWIFTVAYHVPDYGLWLAENGSRNAYAHHRRIMQHYTWQRRQREANEQRNWLLKTPFHLKELEVLLETYPDAVFIQTHREPVELIGSWNSIVERIRGSHMEPRPPHETGTEQLAFMSGMLNDAMRFRASRPELDARWVDVRYTDLVSNPMAVVRDVYARFDWPLEPAAVDTMETWLSLQAEQRRREPRHEYSLEEYGLASEDVNDAFAPYRQFVSARGIM